MTKQKLELTWIGKDQQPNLEPRILIEDPDKSYGDLHAENMLIHGDNLLALKALEQDFAGKVKCIYVDPPFNTGQAFAHYEDGLEHSHWLQLIYYRFGFLHRLLSPEGTLFVHIDDNELGYLVVLLDEIFGRNNRLYTITFKQGAVTGHKAINPGCVTTTNFVLMYSKDKSRWTPNRVYTPRERDKRYTRFLENPEDAPENWKIITLIEAFCKRKNLSLKNARTLIKNEPQQLEQFVLNMANHVIRTARPDYKSVGAEARKAIDLSKKQPERMIHHERQNYPDMYFIAGERILFYADKLQLIDGRYVAGEALTTLWDDILSNNLHKEGQVRFPKGKKPEGLIKRILDLSTNEGDLVLDSFLGSGTTSAVAHKMNRRWIGVELRDHADTHCTPRLKRVCDGTDQDGISKVVNWQGGGGFKYYELAPSLLNQDKHGNWVISGEYNPDMLAAAMAKHEGFRYNPDPEVYWKQGRSSEKDYIFTTTNFIRVDFLDRINEEMREDEHLLICCKKFSSACVNRYPNIEVKKIPQMLLGRCEFGRDDYSLNIVNMPRDPEAPECIPKGPPEPSTNKQGKKTDLRQQKLF